MTHLTPTEQNTALAILQDCIDNGRIDSFDDGVLNPSSVQVEVSFEAGEQGYDDETAEAMGDYASENF
jgi:hypothetical protein